MLRSERVLKLMYDGLPRPSRPSNCWESTAWEGSRTGCVAFQNTLSENCGRGCLQRGDVRLQGPKQAQHKGEANGAGGTRHK